MGVYINGMEMPKDRPQLLWVYPNGKALTVQSDVDPWKELQAVPVPPHGRLIEKNAVFELIRSFPNVDRQLPVEFMKALYELPTIIEAEEGET